MSPEQKRYFWKRNGKLFAGMSGTVGLCGGGFIASHYEQAPVTGRWRLLLYSHEVEVQMGDHATEEILSTMKRPNDKARKKRPGAQQPGPQQQKEQQQKEQQQEEDKEYEGGEELPASHPLFQRVERVRNRLVKALRKLGPEVVDPAVAKNLKWELHVIRAPTPEVNAFVLPNGAIFVYVGLLDQECVGADGDDKLAIVMGHEMAHALQRHSGENFSEQVIVDGVLLALAFASSAMGLDFLGTRVAADLLLLRVQKFFVEHMFTLPHSRACEVGR